MVYGHEVDKKVGNKSAEYSSYQFINSNKQSLAFYGSVTSLAFAPKNLLLAGRGSVLSIYDWNSGELLKDIKLFKRNKIQGIAVGMFIA